MGRFGKKTMKRILFALAAVILVGGVAHAVFIDVFNKTEHSTFGADETQQTYLQFNDRADSTSTWVKRDYDLYGQTVDLQAQTVDGTFFNKSDDTVSSWEMTINIEEDCFINNAWVGIVEIHQFVGTDKEATQTLDLRNYKLPEVELTYLYDGDLLIPLQKGDYLVYHPDAKDEQVIAPHGELTMGMIFYYLNELKLSDYTITYYYHRDLTYGLSFIALAVLAILWVLLLAGSLVADASYKRAMKEMELRKSGLASMSSIYSIITFIDLQNDVLIPIYAHAQTKEALPEGSNAREKLIDIFARDTAEPYCSGVLDFIDTATLPERMDSNSIMHEYVSKAYGWSRIRLFAVEREEGQPLERVLLTIQDINDEKQQLKEFEQRSAQVEVETSTRSSFIVRASENMRFLTELIESISKEILAESSDDVALSHARQIQIRSQLLTYLIDGIRDSANLYAINPEKDLEEYSFSEMISGICDLSEAVAVDMDLTFDAEVSAGITDRLIGDVRRLEQALIGIIAYEGRREGTKNVKMNVFGTAQGANEHILFSIKTDGMGMTAKEAQLLTDFVADIAEYGVRPIDDSIQDLESIAMLLMAFDSKLQVVNEPGSGCELYFEIDQRIANSLSSEG